MRATPPRQPLVTVALLFSAFLLLHAVPAVAAGGGHAGGGNGGGWNGGGSTDAHSWNDDGCGGPCDAWVAEPPSEEPERSGSHRCVPIGTVCDPDDDDVDPVDPPLTPPTTVEPGEQCHPVDGERRTVQDAPEPDGFTVKGRAPETGVARGSLQPSALEFLHFGVNSLEGVSNAEQRRITDVRVRINLDVDAPDGYSEHRAAGEWFLDGDRINVSGRYGDRAGTEVFHYRATPADPLEYFEATATAEVAVERWELVTEHPRCLPYDCPEDASSLEDCTPTGEETDDATRHASAPFPTRAEDWTATVDIEWHEGRNRWQVVGSGVGE